MDAVEYKNGQKNHWRRTAWNRIAENTLDRKNAIVLYLPGSKDLDSPEAIRRGFLDNNLIAIESNKAVVKHLRSTGRLVIPTDIRSVLSAWRGPMVSVVVADLQCCLTDYVWDVFRVWSSNKCFANGTLLLNVQRGREVELRDGAYRFAKSMTCEGRPLSEYCQNRFGTDEKSRFPLLMGMVQAHTASRYLDAIDLRLKRDGLDPLMPAEVAQLHLKAARFFSVTPLPSYSSSRVVMDSALIECNGLKQRFDHSIMEDLARERLGFTKKTTRLIAAALATRTMRLNGTANAA